MIEDRITRTPTMSRLFAEQYVGAARSNSGTMQFLKGLAEQSDDIVEQEECQALYNILLRVQERIGKAEKDCRARQHEFRIFDPEGWEVARSLGGTPCT